MFHHVVFVCFFVVQALPPTIKAHGMLMEPVNRGSAWKKGYNTTVNWDDNQNYCGSFSVHYYKNHGKCGVCGDDYSERQPRDNENGGKYGSGTIVKNYKRGQKILLQVELDTNHLGYFEFAVCPLNSTMDIATESCFEAFPIYLMKKKRRYEVSEGLSGLVNIKGILPKNLSCQHCVLRWHYYCGNNWGICPDGNGRLGCGPQETFRTCSDIAIH